MVNEGTVTWVVYSQARGLERSGMSVVCLFRSSKAWGEHQQTKARQENQKPPILSPFAVHDKKLLLR